jgi:methionyl-tRNA synthetase
MTEEITIDEFARIDLRAAKVVEASAIEGADRLVRLIVDLGGERRQLVAGIKKTYAPETLVGKHIIVVANLKPAELRGVESRGMLLAATTEEGPILATFDKEVAPGSKVK